MQILSPCQIHSNTVSDPNECPALSHQPIMPSESIPMSNDGAAGEKNSRSPELSPNTFAHMKRSKQNDCYDSTIHIKPLFHKGCEGSSCPVRRELEEFPASFFSSLLPQEDLFNFSIKGPRHDCQSEPQYSLSHSPHSTGSPTINKCSFAT